MSQDQKMQDKKSTRDKREEVRGKEGRKEGSEKKEMEVG